jgi:GTP-binding protein
MTASPAIQNAEFMLSAPHVAELPAPTCAEIVFAGKSNVGKSSLINAVLGRQALARVSATPGCTRGINLFQVELGQVRLHFVDLPGYGYAERSKRERKAWGPMIEGYLRERIGIALIVVIVDVRRGVTDEDQQLLEFLDSLNHRSLVIATKLDKLPKARQKPALDALRKEIGREVIGFSSETQVGRDTLLARLGRAAIGGGETAAS